MKRAQTIVIWRRYLRRPKSLRPSWGPWEPQFTATDARRNHHENSPRHQIKRLLQAQDEKYVDFWAVAIAAGRLPAGRAWRITHRT